MNISLELFLNLPVDQFIKNIWIFNLSFFVIKTQISLNTTINAKNNIKYNE